MVAIVEDTYEPPAMPHLDHLNACSREAFVTALGEIFEHAAWVAEVAFEQRPFATIAALHDAMMRAVREAPQERQLALIDGHPELGSKFARRGDLTEASKTEQGALGLDRLSEEEFGRFERLNRVYRQRFDFPFVICVRRHTRDSILAQFERRSANDLETERASALEEIGLITRLRLVAKVEGPGKPKTDGRLSTHILDTFSGRPASGVKLELFEIGGSARGLLVSSVTNEDGRTDAPLIGGGPLRIGTYELAFHTGAYFARRAPLPDPPFLDVIPVRFAIAEPEGHYHVPLLATPWSYSTYRGS